MISSILAHPNRLDVNKKDLPALMRTCEEKNPLLTRIRVVAADLGFDEIQILQTQLLTAVPSNSSYLQALKDLQVRQSQVILPK